MSAAALDARVEGTAMTMRTLRVRVHAGRLEPLDDEIALPEGTEVSIQLEEPRRGSPEAILAAMRAWPHLEPEDVDALERAIEDGKLPVRTEGIFDAKP